MYSKSRLSKIQKKNEEKYEKMVYAAKYKEWGELDLPDPFEIVKDFIKEKGLKLYGGKALDDHLKKKKSPLYGKKEFPDYDVYSPNAWEHAKEVARRLQKAGFVFVEAKSSILNDYHHSTFKVGIDALYVLDITQMGCTPQEMKNKDCKECGMTKDHKCLSYFNALPANVVTYTGKNPRIFRETYDFKNDRGLFPDKFFICNADYLKASMYREMTEPFYNPVRYAKVGSRLGLMEKNFETQLQVCSKEHYEKIINKSLKPVLKSIAEYVKETKVLNYGASAHNLFVRNRSGVASLPVSDYKVYYGTGSGTEKLSSKRRSELTTKYKEITKGKAGLPHDLLVRLSLKYPKMEFGLFNRLNLWKQHDDDDTVLFVKIDGKVNNLITFTKQDGCMPYITFNGVRYVTIERIKYLYLNALSTPNFHRKVDNDPQNYRCLLTDLMKAEKMTKKRNRKNYRGKFRKNVTRCQGDQFSKIQESLALRWMDKLKLMKTTKVFPNKPRRGLITKISKMPRKDLHLPFRPEEEILKKKLKK